MSDAFTLHRTQPPVLISDPGSDVTLVLNILPPRLRLGYTLFGFTRKTKHFFILQFCEKLFKKAGQTHTHTHMKQKPKKNYTLHKHPFPGASFITWRLVS